MKTKLWIIPVVMYLSLSILYLFAIPTGESPDEPSHLQCIEQVAIYNRIPIIDPPPQGKVWWARERIISGLVCAHMPLYYFITGYTQQAIYTIFGIPIHYEFPPNNPYWATQASPAMFMHSQNDPFFKLNEPINLVILRMESILLGLVSMFSVYLITKAFTEDKDISIYAMTLLAGWPQFLFISRAINNDVLTVAFSACTITILLAGKNLWKYALASFFAVLAILSKITAIFTIPVIALGLLLEVIDQKQVKSYLPVALICLLIFILLGALLFLQPTLRSHLGWSHQTISNPNLRAHTLGYWLEVAHTTVQSGWARFGWMNILTPNVLAYSWWIFIISMGSIGLYQIFTDSKRNRVLGSLASIWLVMVAMIYIRINLDRFQPQFRYAFAAIPVLLGLVAKGSQSILFKRTANKHNMMFIAIVSIILSVINLWFIFGFLVPIYAQ